MAFKISPFHMEANGSPFERRNQSKKEVRLSKKLEKTKDENATQYFEDTGKGSDRRERKAKEKS